MTQNLSLTGCYILANQLSNYNDNKSSNYNDNKDATDYASTYCWFIPCYEPNNTLSNFISTIAFNSLNFPITKVSILLNL